MSNTQTVTLRQTATPADREHVRAIVESTGMFRPDEVDVAVELVDERLAKGEPSGYYFLFAEQQGRVVGYACYGPIACTVSSFDLFWIAVCQDQQGRGLGRRLLEESERLIARAGGTRIYIETSGRSDYLPTRRFYERCGYAVEATLADFYAPGDDRVIFGKVLGAWQDQH
ncbi:MAG: GNAT family N-acetyltransferase [Planctomycetaceae bacterium]|nr:GNAT family N-acetyltransferase [Planctomycetaceae bacterium]